jgi:hypothetical protein
LLYEPADVASRALAHLGHGPLVVFKSARPIDIEQLTKDRYEVLVETLEMGKSFFPKDQKGPA